MDATERLNEWMRNNPCPEEFQKRDDESWGDYTLRVDLSDGRYQGWQASYYQAWGRCISEAINEAAMDAVASRRGEGERER